MVSKLFQKIENKGLKERLDYWMSCKKEAAERGQWREVERLTKIINFQKIGAVEQAEKLTKKRGS